jgi:Flp pilus assembly secretin CpaC
VLDSIANKRFVIVTALALVHWSAASAGASFKVAQPPSGARQEPTVDAGSSFKVVKPAPDARLGQAEAPVVPHPDEALPGEPVAAPQNQTGVTLSSPVVPQQIILRADAARLVSFAEPFSSIHVANPTVVDASPVTDHSILLRALKEGYSDIYLVKGDGNVANTLQVTVDNFVSIKGRSLPDPEASSLGSVEIHNKAKLDSQTNYRCGLQRCYYTGEITVSEPVPLPSGYQKQEVEQRIDQTNRNAPTPPTQ